MEKQWADFKAVKAAVTMTLVLDHYGINWLRKKDDELRGRCPIHKGEGTDTFHVSLSKNAFHCFSCKARGNVIDLVAAMEQTTVRDAALKLQQWFAISGSAGAVKQKDTTAPAKSRGEQPTQNKPLGFELKGVDVEHPYLAQRGIDKQTAQTFGVGYFGGRGSMSGRIVIPIHNERGELVAYAGRSIDGSEPRYKLPVGFKKSLELFSLHRAILNNDQRRVVIVEGFFDCMKVHEAGYPSVALMGCSLSEEQERLVCSYFTSVIFMLDGDEAGRAGVDDCLKRLVRKLWVKAMALPEQAQPDSLSADELRQLLSS
jgi:DNA primase